MASLGICDYYSYYHIILFLLHYRFVLSYLQYIYFIGLFDLYIVLFLVINVCVETHLKALKPTRVFYPIQLTLMFSLAIGQGLCC